MLLANIIWTSQFFAVTDLQRAALPTAELDRIASLVIFMLVDYKFYTLFAMLFGLGFSMQLSRATRLSANPIPTYRRRLAILFLLGVAHGIFLWFGDILHIYALVGIILILLRDRSDKSLLILAGGLALFTSLTPFLEWLVAQVVSSNARVENLLEAEKFFTLTSGVWLDVVKLNWSHNVNDYLNSGFGFDSVSYLYLSVLWKFLIGFVAGRRMLLQKSDEYVAQYRRLLPWAATIGLLGNAYLSVSAWVFDLWIPSSSSPLIRLSWVFVEISMFALSLSYLSLLVVLFHRPSWRDKVGLLAPVGRMALTNYLTQSLFIVFLFYGAGLGLLGKVGSGVCAILSLIIFALQIYVSRWWLSRYRFGPIEWVWRCFTYGMRQPLRISAF